MRWWVVILALVIGIVLVVGIMGVSYEDTIEDIPVPADGTGCAISEEALPKPPYGDFLPVEVDADWDQDTVWVGIITGQERARLIAASTLDNDLVVECDPETIEFEAGGPNSQTETGFTWVLHEDDHYAITGEYGVTDGSGGILDGIGDGDETPLVTMMDVEVDAHASLGSTLMIALGAAEAITVIAGLASVMKGKDD